jgi:small-conductance mechanosensitive channel
MSRLIGFTVPQDPWIIIPAIVLTAAVCAYLVNEIILRLVRPVVEKNHGEIGRHIIRLLGRFLYPLLILGGLLVIEDAVPLPPKWLRAAHSVLIICALVLVTVLITKATLLFVRSLGSRFESMRNISQPLEVFIKVAFFVFGGIMIADNLGIAITPLVTTLGIGSLAIAIALQDTLGNLFAGLYIKADRPLQVGHYIKLSTGEEGYVERIGWRNTQIRELPKATVHVPNSKLVQSNIINFHGRGDDSVVLVQLRVHYNNDLEKVEQITCQVAREMFKSLCNRDQQSDTFVRFSALNPSGIDFAVALSGRGLNDSFLFKHEFIKRLHRRYQEEGITVL